MSPAKLLLMMRKRKSGCAEGSSHEKTSKTSLTRKAMQALSDAVVKVVEDHQRRGRPLAVWRGGKAVWISATEAAALRETPVLYRTKSYGAKT